MQHDLWTWEDFKRETATSPGEAQARRIVYRGQAEAEWGLVSSFDRDCPVGIGDRPSYYRKMLSFFAYQLRQYGEDLDGKSYEDRAAIAQHYGMPTRLIDWSTSPYIAAFMAFSSALAENRLDIGKRVAIWSLNLDRFHELNEGAGAQFRLVKTRLLENDRVWRQSGLFIEQLGDGKPLETHLAERAGGTETGLVKWTLPTDLAESVLNDLILMGLTPATVYPDRDGAAKYVRLRMALDRLGGTR